MTLFVDMDGTLAEFKVGTPIEELYKPNYFLDLKPLNNVIDGLKKFQEDNLDIKIIILSSYLLDRENAKGEKRAWIKRNCSFIKDAIFIPCGLSKKNEVTDDVNFLLDDYSVNLVDFHDGKTRFGIKLLNGINGKGEKWTGDSISSNLEPAEFSKRLKEIIGGANRCL